MVGIAAGVKPGIASIEEVGRQLRNPWVLLIFFPWLNVTRVSSAQWDG
jgi:hypothetical protein